jgi:hypothetical protein
MVRTVIGLILVLAVFVGLGLLGWHFTEDRIRHKQEYFLSADKIVIVPPPPDWIPDRFVEDVLRSAGLSQSGSLLDKSLPQKLTEAFVADPWVERVESVVPRYPSGAEVKLSYRMPVALVAIPQRGMFPVDRNGIVLPSTYLSNTVDRRSEHFLIQGIQSMPLGSVGTPWGDPMVQTAAQLAEALTDIAEPLKLTQIVPAIEPIPGGTRIVCQLRTATGTEIHWGAFVPGDPKTEVKKKRLRDLHEQFRTLDNVPTNFRDLSRE